VRIRVKSVRIRAKSVRFRAKKLKNLSRILKNLSQKLKNLSRILKNLDQKLKNLSQKLERPGYTRARPAQKPQCVSVTGFIEELRKGDADGFVSLPGAFFSSIPYPVGSRPAAYTQISYSANSEADALRDKPVKVKLPARILHLLTPPPLSLFPAPWGYRRKVRIRLAGY
jgi:hypothetical protein